MSDTEKWNFRRAFLKGFGVGLALVAISLLRGTDFAAGAANSAEAAVADLTPFFFPVMAGLVGLAIATIRNLFVR